MGWFSSSNNSSKNTAAQTPEEVAEERLIGGGGFHGTAQATRIPVRASATTGTGTGDATGSASPSPAIGNASEVRFAPPPSAPLSLSGKPQLQSPFEQQQTLAATYFTQGTPETIALIGSFQNQLHRWGSYACGLGAYSFGSAMHVTGQGSAITTATMCAAGTCFFLNAQNRNINGPTADIFWFETLGSWLWMLSSFQQFSATKRMKYAGYSSWSGLAVCMYFSTRYLIDLQKTGEAAVDAPVNNSPVPVKK